MNTQAYSGPRFRTRYTVTPGGVPTEEYTGPRFSYTEEPKVTGKNDEMAGEQTYTGPRGPVMQPAETEPAGRPRIVSQPNSAAYEKPGDANRTHLDAFMEDQPVDENGRLKSALIGGLGQIQPTDSIGNMIGQRIAGALNGLIRPQRDEEEAHQREFKRRTQMDEQQRKRDEDAAKIDLTKAQTENQRSMPVFRTEQEIRKAEEGARRLDAVERRVESQDAYNRGRLGQGERKIDESVRSNKERETDRDADRAIREAEGEKNRQSREKIASVYAEIQSQRTKLSEREFEQKQTEFRREYPGYWKPPLTLSELEASAKGPDGKVNTYLLGERKKEAVVKGYEIDYNK